MDADTPAAARAPKHSALALARNATVTYQQRVLSAIIAGCVAGTLGLQSWRGFVLYVVWMLCVHSPVVLAHCGFSAERFFTTGLRGVLVDNILSGALTFVLIWSLVYNIVYVY
mmetsp:Transcript_47745/g.116990  ORF Transcript_47745/g.116990 Transcript_47745/m.116990 type:complete len:113 (+) Transcript_47745:138-476(+)